MKIKKYINKLSNTHCLFIFIALIFGIVFVFMTPPLWGPDEVVHFARSYQISEGNLTKNQVSINGQKSYGGGLPESLVSLNSLKDADINDRKSGETSQVDSLSEYSVVGGIPLVRDKVVANPFGNLAYPTITYIAPAVGIAIANLAHPSILPLMYVARLMTLMLYIILTFVSLYILRKSSLRWLVFVVALLPSTLYQASVVSADPLITSLCFVLLSLFYYITHEKKQIRCQYTVFITLIALFIAFLKPPYLLLLLILPFLHINASTHRWNRLFLRIGIPILSALVAFFVVSGLGLNPSTAPPGVNFSAQLHWIICNIFSYVTIIVNSFLLIDWIPQIVGLFGSSFIYIPMPLIYVLLFLLAIATFIKLDSDSYSENETKITTVAYIGFSIACIVAIITTLFLAYTRVGAGLVSGVQGRYFIPILVFLMYGVRSFVRIRLTVAEKDAQRFFPAIMVFCLVFSILWYYKILY